MKISADSSSRPLLCPSARPDMDGSVVIGVVGGTVGEPVVRYLREPLAVTPEVLDLTSPVSPQEVLRFAAPCATSDCIHYDGAHCQLGKRAAKLISLTVFSLPPCGIRATCRWFAENGAAICRRCPAIVTENHQPSATMREVAIR